MKTRLMLAQLEAKNESDWTIVLSCKGKKIHVRLSTDMWTRIFMYRVTNVGTHRLLSHAEYGHLYVHIPAGYDPRVWYFASEQLPTEVMEPIIDKMMAHRLKEMEIETGSVVLEQQRQPIPRAVQILVWQRDGSKCVQCGSQEDLELDHVQPPSQGGSNKAGNLQVLCAKCRGEKGGLFGSLISPDNPFTNS
ncbi:MAG: HNH endonuclease [Anaerolineales bacterium]|nr:HNH endonuclease [Anaerolineales bacterium]